MNFEVFTLLPLEGHVLQVYVRYGKLEFLIGFCRGVLIFEQRVQFIDSFRQVTNASMTVCRAELCEFAVPSLGKLSFDLCREKSWMNAGR